MVNLQNESSDKLVNGSIMEAVISSYEEAWSFGGIQWLWPIVFLFTLIIVAIKSESPTMVAIYAILGNLALGTMLEQLTHIIFASILVFSIMIWLFSLFLSRKIE